MTEQEKAEQEKAFEEWWLKTYHPWNVVQCARDGFLAGYALGECVHGSAEARGDRAQAVMDALHAIEGADDVITEDDICNQLLDHWAEQNKPHLDDEDKCCYALAVRAADEIRRLRAEVDALRAAIGNLDITGGGVEFEVRQALLGHSPGKVTHIYSPVNLDRMQRAVDALCESEETRVRVVK